MEKRSNCCIFVKNREVSERLKEHAWKVCKHQKCFEGSNPFLSALKKLNIIVELFSLHNYGISF